MNLTPNEVLIVALLALVVLGPKHLPEAMRRAGRVVRDLRKWSTTVRQEVEAAVSPPEVLPPETAPPEVVPPEVVPPNAPSDTPSAAGAASDTE